MNAPPAGSAELGKLLCATRMRLGKDLQRVADILHIRYNYLVAIEDGRYEDLPGQAYAIGFVRAYADHLGLDGGEIVRRYKEESAGVKHKSAFEFQMPTSDSALPSGTLLFMAVVAGMLIYGLWYSMAGSDRSAVELIQEVPDRLAAIADPSAIEAALPVTTPAPAASATPAIVDGADLATQPGATPLTGEAPASARTEIAAALPPPAAVPPPVAAPPLITDVLELRAKADVWVTLRDARAVERTHFLRKDEVMRLPEQGVTTLVTANAGDLEILLNGKAMPPLDAGLFARGVALDPQKLKGAASVPVGAPSLAPTPAAGTQTAITPPATMAPAKPLSAPADGAEASSGSPAASAPAPAAGPVSAPQQTPSAAPDAAPGAAKPPASPSPAPSSPPATPAVTAPPGG